MGQSVPILVTTLKTSEPHTQVFVSNAILQGKGPERLGERTHCRTRQGM